MKILDYLKENRLYLDGAMGSLLQSSGLQVGELPERWNISHPEVVRQIHKSYFDAGSNVVLTNTFGANGLKFDHTELQNIVKAAISNAKWAAENSLGDQPKWVALDIGPLGKLLRPIGDLDFEDAVKLFGEVVRIGSENGADLIFIETMGDSYEAKAALLAAKENSDLPVFVSCAFGEDGKLMTGASPAAMVALLEGMGADAIGVNCSLGPKSLEPIIKEYVKYSSKPIIMKPNAGLPKLVDGKTTYSLTPEDFADQVATLSALGVNILGGCCGSSPEYISALVKATKDLPLTPVTKKQIKLVSSYTHAVEFGAKPMLIGERINPTGKPKFKDALLRGDVEYVLREAVSQEDAGAHILDVNVGMPGVSEHDLLPTMIERIQEVVNLPLQIDTADTLAMEKALRRYNGKAMINSVNGKADSMAKVFPLVKKYGGVVVCLTLDENGIPETAEGRFEIAKKILAEAEKYGIDSTDLIFDPLAMAISADKNAALETLMAVKLISEILECDTSLGVSNVSFGLPERGLINASFMTQAMIKGLSAAIINPRSPEIMNAYYSYLALSGMDDNFEKYISRVVKTESVPTTEICDLTHAILKGLKQQASDLAKALLIEKKPLDIINEDILPALDRVGVDYEQKKIYLPGLLMSAEAAGAAFEVIRSAMPKGESYKAKIILATVKGDIHDIGKNILKLILENYGFRVIDLGKDVPQEKILSVAESERVDIVGLSALMTTTLPAMEDTVKLLKSRLPGVKIMVGGAVLTEEYAMSIGADFYGKDAMEAVRFAEKYTK